MWTSAYEKFLRLLATSHVYEAQEHVLGRVVTANQVKHDVGVPYTLLNGVGVPQIILLRHDRR